MLLLQYPLRERVFIVAIEHRHSFLQDDRSVIEFLIDEVHRASRDFHAVREGLLLRL